MTVPVNCSVIQICSDLSVQKSGYLRAFYARNPRDPIGVTFFGYCDSKGSHRTVKAVVSEVRQFDKVTPIYRNGKLTDKGVANG